MARIRRKGSTSGIYHVMVRGINQQRLFEEEADCTKYLDCLSEVKKKSGLTLFAYCLMGNHVHLLLREGNEPISITMKRLGVKYAYWFNNKYQRSGHLFQDRYKSEPVCDDAYFFAVLRYIYQNPVKARLCAKTDEYAWSSRRLFGKDGSLDGLIDERELAEIVSVKEIVGCADALLEVADTEDAVRRGRPMRFLDEDAVAKMREFSGAATSAAFQKLDSTAQRRNVLKMAECGISLRQQARITGISNGVIERWVSKRGGEGGGGSRKTK
jgi:REP element-mobilizing transposase RayT